MAIQIKELIVKTVVTNNRKLRPNSHDIDLASIHRLKKEIVRECKAQLKREFDRENKR